jgi:hypothetical protein
MPGSTPCGACQVGIATPTRVYVSLNAAFDQDTTLFLMGEPPSGLSVTVHAPANQRVFSEAVALPADLAKGVPLSDDWHTPYE